MRNREITRTEEKFKSVTEVNRKANAMNYSKR